MAKIAKVSEIKNNPTNPRKIDKVALEKLKKSIQEFPEMLELRPIVINKDGVVLGGNMRLRAMKELGIKECPVEVADKLTPEQEREFVIKDNVSGGDWDWDIIDTDWSDLPLDDWGLSVNFSDDLKSDPKTEETKPYKKIHALITFGIDDSEKLSLIVDFARSIGVQEIETSAN